MCVRRAFTFIELMIVVVIVAILSLAALPDDETQTNESGREAAKRLESDIDYARSLSIARPDDRVVVRVSVTKNTYWLARAATPDVPITHPVTKQPYQVQYGTGGPKEFEKVKVVGVDFNGDLTLGFDAYGNIDQPADALVQLTSGQGRYEMKLASIGSKSKLIDSFTGTIVNVAEPGSTDTTTTSGTTEQATGGTSGTDSLPGQ